MTADTPPARGAETVFVLPPSGGAIVLCRTCPAVTDLLAPPGWALGPPPLPRHPDFGLGVCPACRLLWGRGVARPAPRG